MRRGPMKQKKYSFQTWES